MHLQYSLQHFVYIRKPSTSFLAATNFVISYIEVLNRLTWHLGLAKIVSVNGSSNNKISVVTLLVGVYLCKRRIFTYLNWLLWQVFSSRASSLAYNPLQLASEGYQRHESRGDEAWKWNQSGLRQRQISIQHCRNIIFCSFSSNVCYRQVDRLK